VEGKPIVNALVNLERHKRFKNRTVAILSKNMPAEGEVNHRVKVCSACACAAYKIQLNSVT